MYSRRSLWYRGAALADSVEPARTAASRHTIAHAVSRTRPSPTSLCTIHKLLLIFSPTESRRLSWPEHTVHFWFATSPAAWVYNPRSLSCDYDPVLLNTARFV